MPTQSTKDVMSAIHRTPGCLSNSHRPCTRVFGSTYVKCVWGAYTKCISEKPFKGIGPKEENK